MPMVDSKQAARQAKGMCHISLAVIVAKKVLGRNSSTLIREAIELSFDWGYDQ
jgi:hypothetical protein